MIWADKAALGLAGLIAFSAAALFGVLMIGTHMEGALSMGADAAQYTGYVLLGLVVPLWLLLRLIHFLQQGRHRRTRRPQTASPRQRGDHASNLKPRR